jgi:hypothetical protein
MLKALFFLWERRPRRDAFPLPLAKGDVRGFPKASLVES